MAGRDFASNLFELIPGPPCSDDGLACTLHGLVDSMVPLAIALMLSIAIGVLAAVSVSVATARLERRRGVPSRGRARRRLVSGPIHTDGMWVRLVEDERGRRIIEVLEGANWRPSDSDLSRLLLDLPVSPQPHG